MQMTWGKWAKVFIVLLAGAYLCTGIAAQAHFHKDGVNQNVCPLCYYYQNCHFQVLPDQPHIVEFILSQISSPSMPAIGYSRIVYHSAPSRAPPQLQSA
jgi:hypothetical protein